MPTGRFPRSARLLKPDQFERAFETGHRVQGKLVSAVASRGTEPTARLGLTVSKKVAQRAHDRNRLKRQIRESFRQNLSRLPAVDIVVTARNGSAAAPASDLRAALDLLWNRIAQACAAP